jgi:hypothetical protein
MSYADRRTELGYEDVAFEKFVHKKQESRLRDSNTYTGENSP